MAVAAGSRAHLLLYEVPLPICNQPLGGHNLSPSFFHFLLLLLLPLLLLSPKSVDALKDAVDAVLMLPLRHLHKLPPHFIELNLDVCIFHTLIGKLLIETFDLLGLFTRSVTQRQRHIIVPQAFGISFDHGHLAGSKTKEGHAAFSGRDSLFAKFV